MGSSQAGEGEHVVHARWIDEYASAEFGELTAGCRRAHRQSGRKQRPPPHDRRLPHLEPYELAFWDASWREEPPLREPRTSLRCQAPESGVCACGANRVVRRSGRCLQATRLRRSPSIRAWVEPVGRGGRRSASDGLPLPVLLREPPLRPLLGRGGCGLEPEQLLLLLRVPFLFGTKPFLVGAPAHRALPSVSSLFQPLPTRARAKHTACGDCRATWALCEPSRPLCPGTERQPSEEGRFGRVRPPGLKESRALHAAAASPGSRSIDTVKTCRRCGAEGRTDPAATLPAPAKLAATPRLGLRS